MPTNKTLGQELYEEYAKFAGWKSLATKQSLPQWSALNLAIQNGWNHIAEYATDRITKEIQQKQVTECQTLYDGL